MYFSSLPSSAHLILLDFITITTCGEEQRLDDPHYAALSILLLLPPLSGPNILPKISFSNSIIVYVKSEVLTEIVMKSSVVWHITRSPLKVSRFFGGKYRIHLQGRGL